MSDKETTLAIAAALVGKLLETPKGFDLLKFAKPADEAMRELGQRVRTLAQALSDVS